VYRDVTVISPERAKILAFYKATKGTFDIKFDFFDRSMDEDLTRAILGLDGMAWAFEGILERRPEVSELVTPQDWVAPKKFEARVKALGGKLADCYPDMHHPRAASAMGRTVYAVGLTCITRDHSGEYDEDKLADTAGKLEWEQWN
jgi:hypothetical protein